MNVLQLKNIKHKMTLNISEWVFIPSHRILWNGVCEDVWYDMDITVKEYLQKRLLDVSDAIDLCCENNLQG